MTSRRRSQNRRTSQQRPRHTASDGRSDRLSISPGPAAFAPPRGCSVGRSQSTCEGRWPVQRRRTHGDARKSRSRGDRQGPRARAPGVKRTMVVPTERTPSDAARVRGRAGSPSDGSPAAPRGRNAPHPGVLPASETHHVACDRPHSGHTRAPSTGWRQTRQAPAGADRRRRRTADNDAHPQIATAWQAVFTRKPSGRGARGRMSDGSFGPGRKSGS
jgi:hypothetical protein